VSDFILWIEEAVTLHLYVNIASTTTSHHYMRDVLPSIHFTRDPLTLYIILVTCLISVIVLD